MYAVTGATGQLGRKAVKSLLKLIPPTEIIALVRDPAKATGLGVTARKADYGQPETLDAAFQGIETLRACRKFFWLTRC